MRLCSSIRYESEQVHSQQVEAMGPVGQSPSRQAGDCYQLRQRQPQGTADLLLAAQRKTSTGRSQLSKGAPAEESRSMGSAEGMCRLCSDTEEEGKGEETHAQGRTWKQQKVEDGRGLNTGNLAPGSVCIVCDHRSALC